jgi:hypothetical protein
MFGGRMFGSGGSVASGATLTLADFKLWTGTLHTSINVAFVKVFRLSTAALVLELVDHPINSGSDMSITDAALVVSADYMVFGWNADGSLSFKAKATAV